MNHHRTIIVFALAAWSILAFIPTPHGHEATGAELRLMTFNVKGDRAGLDPDRSWVFIDLTDPTNPVEGPGRRDRAISVIDSYAPDILSVQELKLNQRSDLMNAFPNLSYYGQGRQGGTNDDANGIFYREDRFDLLDQGDFWLSETPEVPGTSFFGNGSDDHNPRMATWAKLRDHEADRSYFVLSTHWSLDFLARRDSATLIQDRLASLSGNLPIILLGDLNATQNSLAYQTLRGLRDPNDLLLADSFIEGGGSDGRTFHNWFGGSSGTRIDHIFHSPEAFEATDSAIVRTSFPGGRYPSDHYPVTVTLRVIPEPSSMLLIGIGLLIGAGRRDARQRRNEFA